MTFPKTPLLQLTFVSFHSTEIYQTGEVLFQTFIFNVNLDAYA